MLGCGGDYFSIISVFSPCRLVSISLLSSFLCVGYSSKHDHYSFSLSIGAQHIQEYFKKRIGGKQKIIYPQQDKARHDDRRNKMRVELRAGG